jgi:hypothetical protein
LGSFFGFRRVLLLNSDLLVVFAVAVCHYSTVKVLLALQKRKSRSRYFPRNVALAHRSSVTLSVTDSFYVLSADLLAGACACFLFTTSPFGELASFRLPNILPPFP